MSIGTGAPWQTRSPQKNNLTSVKRQVINFMMQNPNAGKWRENNSAVSNSACPHPSTQPPKKPLFKTFCCLGCCCCCFQSSTTIGSDLSGEEVRTLCCMIYDLWLIKSQWVSDGQMWIRSDCGLDQVTCPTPETSNSGPAETKTSQFNTLTLKKGKSQSRRIVAITNVQS